MTERGCVRRHSLFLIVTVYYQIFSKLFLKDLFLLYTFIYNIAEGEHYEADDDVAYLMAVF